MRRRLIHLAMMPQPESNLPERYLSVKEYARLFGVCEKTVHRYLKKGRISKHQPGGPNCHVGIPASELEVTAKPPTVSSAGSPGTAADSAAADPPAGKSASKAADKRPLKRPAWMR